MASISQSCAFASHETDVGEAEVSFVLVFVLLRRSMTEGEAQVGVVEVFDRNDSLATQKNDITDRLATMHNEEMFPWPTESKQASLRWRKRALAH